MTTFAQAAAERCHKPIPIVTVEGVGDYAGLWKFCTRCPKYAFTTSAGFTSSHAVRLTTTTTTHATVSFGDIAGFDGVDRFTIMGWVKVHSNPQSAVGLIHKSNEFSSGQNQFEFRIGTGTTAAELLVCVMPTLATFFSAQHSYSAFFDYGVWRFFAWVYNASEPNATRHRVYKGDVLQTPSATSGTVPTSVPTGGTQPLRLGRQVSLPSISSWLRDYDNLAFYPGVAATQAQITESYAGGRVFDYAASSLGLPVHWYKADNDLVDSGSGAANGTGTGDVTFVTDTPPAGAPISVPDTLYKPWLKRDTAPSEVPEEVPVLGGVAESGEIQFELTDGLGGQSGGDYNALTSLLRTDAGTGMYLSAAVATAAAGASTTNIDIKGPSAEIDALIAGSTIVFVGIECWRLTTLQVTTDHGDGQKTKRFTVTRGWLDTVPTAHQVDAAVYRYIPFTEGRRVRLKLAFDLDTFSAAEEKEIGPGWRLEDEDLGDKLGSYIFRGLSNMGPIDRSLCRKRMAGTIIRLSGNGENVKLGLDNDVWGVIADNAAHFADGIWLRCKDEIAFATQLAQDHWRVRAADRGQIGTRIEEWKVDDEVAQVFPAYGGTSRSSLRFQEPGTETSSRGTGTWIKDERCEHPVPLVLCLLTSSATPDNSDGLAVSNWEAGSGNFSALPPGVGAGIPISQIDWASFHAVWHRTAEWRMSNFILDGEVPAREIVERICKLTRMTVTIRNGKLRLDLASTIPTLSATGAATWTRTEMLTERIEKGVERTRLSIRKATELASPTVIFRTKRPNGREHQIVFNDGDFPQLFGHIRGFYGQDRLASDLDAHDVLADSSGGSALLEKSAEGILYWVRKPPPDVTLFTSMSYVDTAHVGHFALLTHPLPPNKRTGTRGWTNVIAYLVRKRLDLTRNEIEWRAIVFASAGKFGLIAPAGVINGAPSGNTATLHQNRFTSSSVPSVLGLPSRDSDAFEVGDRVRLRSLSGVLVATTPTYQTVSLVAPNLLTLDGNFGGAWASGHVIVPADWADAVTAQKNKYVAYADPGTLLLNGVDECFVYGMR